MRLATLDELKAHLNMSPGASTNDPELELVLYAAQDVVTNIAGDYSDASITETVPVSGGTALLSRRPSGTVRDVSGDVVANVNRAAGVINFLSPYIDRITVSYDAGGGFPPYAVKLACLIVASHLWETQRGTSPSALALQGADPGAFPTGQGYAIPNRAQELLAQYVRSPGIA